LINCFEGKEFIDLSRLLPFFINNSIELLYPQMDQKNSKWRIAVDRGGTFTDVVGLDPSGGMRSLKLLSRSLQYKDASIEGIRRMIGLARGEPLPEDNIEGIRFGTTVATNALLERKGGRIALLITKGFSDLLEIGYQDRPEIFKLCIKKSPPLYSAVVEVDERIDSGGSVIRGPDIEMLSSEIRRIKKAGVHTAAVVMMHSWKNPTHELLCEGELRKQGLSNVFLSHRTVNLIKIVSRGQSTLVDAYLSTVLAEYLEGIKKDTGTIPVEFMESSGILSPPGSFRGKNAILSGPAGGAVAVGSLSNTEAAEGAIGFDMGGTSTDVSKFDNELERIFERKIAGIPLQVEMLDIITVAAGGGSILRFDGQKMTAGPESAGSHPGPASYGFGGPLTITDANLITGRLIPAYFPETFGPGANEQLDADIVKEKFNTITNEINAATGTDLSPSDAAAGFLRVANEKMATAIKEISVSRGFDVRKYAMVCFGGAGGQHACSIASLLDIETIIIHPLSSVLSAYGIGLSRPAWKTARTVLRPYDRDVHLEFVRLFQDSEKRLLMKRGRQDENYILKRWIDLRPEGADTYITIEYLDYDETRVSFNEQYTRLFGFVPRDTELEVVNIRVEVLECTEFLPTYKNIYAMSGQMPSPDAFNEIYYADGPVRAPVYLRDTLPISSKIKGPAFIIDRDYTVIVDPGFEADMDDSGVITMRRVSRRKEQSPGSSKGPDPVLLEVFNNFFMGISSEMGIALKNTAHSVNMKERLDFSCAVFDAQGDLVANAPHIPVHLGAMADTVKAVLESEGNAMLPGDIFLMNNPYLGGSHLPDMTVVCPVFSEERRVIFFTAARGHHSDVGGTTPGSMPPLAAHIDEEGVMISSFLLVRDSIFREDKLREVLSGHKYPVRNISERVSDFKAQIAACHKGMKDLKLGIERYGLTTVRDYMGHIQDNSEYSVKKALHGFLDGKGSFKSSFEDCLDDGTPIQAAVSIEGGTDSPETLRAVIDFTGTGKQHTYDNLNAPYSVTRSAVMYVLRSLIDTDMPLNSGCLKPVKIIIPGDTILNPSYPAPVASGNVETSQRVVDVLLGAFGVAAASQGTMNNFLFEVEGEIPYYETIAGGAGALEDCPGASGVQVHMTNTRITDPEILEFRHPGVRLEQFTLRRGSGGSGKYRGGDGVIREMAFLRPATVSILSERRNYEPYGIKGGENGKKGINLYKKANGEVSALGHREVLRINENESVIIKTPGGGGYGA
jgi:5-oxoprolinase (ATP-hydrolysing)